MSINILRRITEELFSNKIGCRYVKKKSKNINTLYLKILKKSDKMSLRLFTTADTETFSRFSSIIARYKVFLSCICKCCILKT